MMTAGEGGWTGGYQLIFLGGGMCGEGIQFPKYEKTLNRTKPNLCTNNDFESTRPICINVVKCCNTKF